MAVSVARTWRLFVSSVSDHLQGPLNAIPPSTASRLGPCFPALRHLTLDGVCLYEPSLLGSLSHTCSYLNSIALKRVTLDAYTPMGYGARPRALGRPLALSNSSCNYSAAASSSASGSSCIAVNSSGAGCEVQLQAQQGHTGARRALFFASNDVACRPDQFPATIIEMPCDAQGGASGRVLLQNDLAGQPYFVRHNVTGMECKGLAEAVNEMGSQVVASQPAECCEGSPGPQPAAEPSKASFRSSSLGAVFWSRRREESEVASKVGQSTTTGGGQQYQKCPVYHKAVASAYGPTHGGCCQPAQYPSGSRGRALVLTSLCVPDPPSPSIQFTLSHL
jgi:hypothetical protein